MSGNDLLLPPEMWFLILVHLPVKSLLRFRCVSRTWYSLVSSPSFITAQTLNQTTNRLLVAYMDLGLCKFSSYDQSFVKSRDHDDLPEPFSTDVGIVGSCNGLICLSSRHDKKWQRFLVWNPSIRKSVELPMATSYVSSRLKCLMGFGFDSESSDYKLVRIVIPRKYTSFTNPAMVESQICDLRKGAWRSSSLKVREGSYLVLHPCVYLNGVLHWIRSCPSVHTMLFFDLSSEVFLEMGLPSDLKEFGEWYPMLFPIKGLLSVALLRRNPYWCSVWSMKEYGGAESWSKLFCIELPSFLNRGLLSLRYCLENGEVLMLDRSDGTNNVLVSYNPERRDSRVLLSISRPVVAVCRYTESLALPW